MSSVIMNTRSRIYVIFFLSIGLIFLLIAIVQNQIDHYAAIQTFTQANIIDFLDTYTTGFPRPPPFT
ncbi:MAG: hypothetical protein H7647_03465 [Candidatus Heimdallarchaeota archaeon]|jgi:hypothetical protein|nr:hypothetical protein [Candidatus Heimdallarchaeota archaeon]MCK4253486.1 hypothetical protein [Candidatus Heimdallarchaeota archaeon]